MFRREVCGINGYRRPFAWHKEHQKFTGLTIFVKKFRGILCYNREDSFSLSRGCKAGQLCFTAPCLENQRFFFRRRR